MTELPPLPFISVIIPTFNRSRMLNETVETIVRQSYPAERRELILVDNNSTDNTSAAIRDLARLHPGITGITERRRGAHFARNTGALASRGTILYFTDDDMLADPHMLMRIVEGFVDGANVASVTGRVLPRWDTEPPRWILEHCRNALLSLNDLGESLIVADDDPGVFSCHQAITRDAFMRAGGFNPDTNAGEFTGDNETGLNIKVKKLGYRFAYVPSAVTHHIIPASRMTQRYVNSRLADQGYCDSYTDYRKLAPGRARLIRRIAAHSGFAAGALVTAVARRAAGKSAWRIDLARAFYHRNRARYDVRLVRHEEWRRFAMRDDWLDTPQSGDR